MITPSGILASIALRLLQVAFSITNHLSLCFSRFLGTGMLSTPLKYFPVSESGLSSSSVICPCAVTLPPWMPAPGPISINKSACRMISSSCSTTITLLPKSLKWIKVSMSRWLSRICKPIEGSSNTYMTPTRPEPIWLASLILCASPPERVSAARLSDR